MVLTGIIFFGVMCLIGFAVGCGIAELEIWMKEREEHERIDKGHGDA